MANQKDIKICSVRIPADIHERVKKQAEKERRSFNSMVASLLDKAAENG